MAAVADDLDQMLVVWGILLALMFVWNMLGALIRIPALSYFMLPTTTVAKSAASKYKRAVAAAKA